MKLRIFVMVLAMMLVAFIAVQAAPKKGERAPGFKLESIAGKMVSLDDIRKDPAKKGATRIVLINFGSTG